MMDWIVFFLIVGGLVASDLWGFDRKDEAPSMRRALVRSAIYVAVAIGFAGWVYWRRGADAGLQFVTGYSLEMSLSFDNIFVISLILGALSIPARYRSRVLFLGIMGAVLLRGAFILTGAFIVGNFQWALIGFGMFLIYTGAKMIRTSDDADISIEDNRTLRILRRVLPISLVLDGRRLFVRGAVTPLLVAIVLVEVADVVFAVDSIPATFAVTTDPFLVLTSNIFAVVGLRSMFFVLEATVHRFDRLGKALAVVLVFIGLRVLVSELTPYDLPVVASLGVVLLILASGIGYSVAWPSGHPLPKRQRPDLL